MREPAIFLIDRIAILIAQAYLLARRRLAGHVSPLVRLTANRDHAAWDLALTRRELHVLRTQRAAFAPRRRPDYTPAQRLEILQIMRLREWSIRQAAERFILHPNTIRGWTKVVQGRQRRAGLLKTPAWNRIHDAVRWAVHELRRLCPEPELGTRTLATHLVRAGLRISRASVQRILRESVPRRRRPTARLVPPASATGRNLLRPRRTNRVWHLDLTSLRLLWRRVAVAAIIDGRSRKLLAVHT